MKAHTVTEKKEIILSIGMIVKNEENVLERCLKSLQPLMAAIPSELIIADTGSTDSTFEIAKKYTDNVFHFEWINDFAAARNSTLEKAQGIWYFFIDADEYLDEDIHEIVEFFKIPELYNYYKCAQINLRNYLDPKLKKSATVMLPRFHRIKNCEEKVEFVGAIHETIYLRRPLGYFQTILNHTGYAFSSNAQRQKKFDRNLELMKEEYENTEPQNRLRIICHIIDCLKNNPEETEEYLKEALEIVKTRKNDFFARSIYLQAVNYYITCKIAKVGEICDEYYEVYPDASKYVTTIGIVLRKAEMLATLGQYREAYQSYLEYFKLYEDYKAEKLDISDLAAHDVNGIGESDFLRCKTHAINCLINLCDYESAFNILEAYDIDDVKADNHVAYISSLKNICLKSRKYSKLAEYYDKILKTNDDNKIGLVLNALEGLFYSWTTKAERENFARQIVENGGDGKYIELMRLYLDQDSSDFIDKLNKFINEIENWKDGYSESIYLAVKNKLLIPEVIMKMKVSLFAEELCLIANTHDDFAGYVLEYGVPQEYLSNIKLFNWIVTLNQVAAYRCFELNESQKYELYLRFTTLLGEYVSNIYNPELLQDEADVEVLPEIHRFGYYMLKANSALADGEKVEYIRELRKALVNCASMKQIVQFLMEQFKKREM